MNNFLKVSLLAAAVAVGLTACQKDEKPAANTAEVKAEASKPAEAPKAAAKSFEEQSGYAIQHVSPLQRTEMVSGRARQRRVYTSVPSMVAVQWLCTELQAQVFELFFRFGITDGADWFMSTITLCFKGSPGCSS
jgi:hypothetical protein